jgi:cysteinyl-tRNA synthetase
MKIYNSLTRTLEEFVPLNGKKVNMYVCGLTPYDSAHIGHARTYVSFDVLKRYLIKKGYNVNHIQNITDVEDKIIKRCKETGTDPLELTSHVHEEALELFDELNILQADNYPKVTEHIPEIIQFIKKLIDGGFAYETETGVYFDISRFENYGKLSGQDMEQIKAGSRKEVDETKNKPADFALWKKTKGEIIEYDSSWSTGRPGWHIECSALALDYAGTTLDIHGGARDLIFPHHENEIAQSETGNRKPFSRYWMHTGFLTVEGEKMSKSLGNFITLKNSLSRFNPNALRMFYLQAHYRSPVDYDEEALQAAGESVERIFNSMGLIKEIEPDRMSKDDQEFRDQSDKLIEKFYSSMDDDLDTPQALAALFSLIRLTNAHLELPAVDHDQLDKILKNLDEFVWILGFKEKLPDLATKEKDLQKLATDHAIAETEAEKILDSLIKLRDELRANKEYEKSDKIRADLLSIGLILEDKEGGVRWRLSA